MKTQYLHNGIDVTARDFVGPDGTTYLAGYVLGASAEELEALGVTMILPPPPPAPPPPPPPPTEEEIAAQEAAAAARDAAMQAQMVTMMRSSRISAINQECRNRITAAWPVEKQISALAGIYGPAELASMTDWIDAHIAASNTATSAVFDLPANSTPQQLEAVTVVWPV